MKKVFVLITGFTPFLIGYGLNLIVLKSGSEVAFVFDIYTIMFFLFWGLMGFVFSKFTSSNVYTLVICHLPALLVLLLILIQELINKQYWHNYLGVVTQFFYLPTIRISFKITGLLSMHKMWETYIISFLLMIAVFYLGGFIRNKVDMAKSRL
ncbi:MAG: hypothetical protein K0R46_1820 [Herbinix sp.]|jgi:hypothetical protein|nr:hypothetical protein [Herbinix sp.]